MKDLIVPLIFIGITILSIIGKSRSKQKIGTKTKSPNSQKQGTLADKIEKFISKVQERIETETGQMPSSSKDWRKLMDGDADSDQAYDSMGVPVLVDVNESDARPEPSAGKIAAASPKRKLPVDPPPASAQVPQAALQSGRLLPKNRSDLRRAVVWAEIIEPPVAFRERHLHS